VDVDDKIEAKERERGIDIHQSRYSGAQNTARINSIAKAKVKQSSNPLVDTELSKESQQRKLPPFQKVRPKQPTLAGDLTEFGSSHGTKTARVASKPAIKVADPHHDQESPGPASLTSMSSYDSNEHKGQSNETPLLKNLQTLGQNIWSNLFKNVGS
jgi:hypothetical protein